VEPLGRGRGAPAAERPPRGAAGGALVLGGRVPLLVVAMPLLVPPLTSVGRPVPERRPGRAVRTAQVVAVLVRTDAQAPVVLGELGRGPGQRRLAQRPHQTARVVVRVIRRAATVARLLLLLLLRLVVVVRGTHVAVVVWHVRPSEVHRHLAHRPAKRNRRLRTVCTFPRPPPPFIAFDFARFTHRSLNRFAAAGPNAKSPYL